MFDIRNSIYGSNSILLISLYIYFDEIYYFLKCEYFSRIFTLCSRISNIEDSEKLQLSMSIFFLLIQRVFYVNLEFALLFVFFNFYFIWHFATTSRGKILEIACQITIQTPTLLFRTVIGGAIHGPC